LFDQTKNLFGRWLYYGLGTMFSLGVLSVMVTLSTDMVIAVAKAFWASSLLGAGPDNVSSMALQQGGLGLVMSMLILSAPPMAAMFFQGTLGSFGGYNVFSQTPSSGYPPGGATMGSHSSQPSNFMHASAAAEPSVSRPNALTQRVESFAVQQDAIKSGPR
jgi:type IV secretion system protein VirB6